MALRLAILVISLGLFSLFAGERAWADAVTPPAPTASAPSQVDDAALAKKLDLPRKDDAVSHGECSCTAHKAGLGERVKARKLEQRKPKPKAAD